MPLDKTWVYNGTNEADRAPAYSMGKKERKMPFKSKAQEKLFFAKEERGELPKGTAEEWAHKTKNIKKLPEHVKKTRLSTTTNRHKEHR
jgi:hypothetical protein